MHEQEGEKREPLAAKHSFFSEGAVSTIQSPVDILGNSINATFGHGK